MLVDVTNDKAQKYASIGAKKQNGFCTNQHNLSAATIAIYNQAIVASCATPRSHRINEKSILILPFTSSNQAETAFF